jgi:hypothetical protein
MCLRTGSRFPKLFSGTFCGYNSFERDFEAVLAMPVTEAAGGKPIESICIEPTRSVPEIPTEPIEARAHLIHDSNQSPLFRCGYIGKRNLDRTDHLTVFPKALGISVAHTEQFCCFREFDSRFHSYNIA